MASRLYLQVNTYDSMEWGPEIYWSDYIYTHANLSTHYIPVF